MTRWEARDRTIRAAGDPIPGVMAIVNITPDSFSDGGRSLSAAAAAEHARDLIQQGADLLDLGAESTRPGSDPVPLEEELRRLLPVLKHLGSEIAVPLSIDTSKARVDREGDGNLRSQMLEYGQKPSQLFLQGHRVRARPGRLGSQVQQVGSLLDQVAGMFGRGRGRE